MKDARGLASAPHGAYQPQWRMLQATTGRLCKSFLISVPDTCSGLFVSGSTYQQLKRCKGIPLLIYHYLVYFDDSADLSYLQWIRLVSGNVCGPSDFTLDPQRHMVFEGLSSLPPSELFDGILPRRNIADTLIDNYFVNVSYIPEQSYSIHTNRI